MAGPQKENGYTPIANELMEAVAKLQINATQFRILMVVWRYTYGFSRKHHKLSETFISKATGIHKKQVGRELSDLIKRNILIEIEPPSFSSTRVLAFNKHYKRWQSTKKLTGNGIVDQTGSELVDSPGSESVDQDKQYLKQNLNNMSDAFNLAELLKSWILINNPKARTPKNLNGWAAEIERMMRIDKRDKEEVEKIINFCQQDGFWWKNILSADKLRKQYDRLSNEFISKSKKNEITTRRKEPLR